MLERIIRYRPKNICAVYAETGHIEVLRATRQWRLWTLEQTERYEVPQGESILDHLQTLNLRPKVRNGSALLLILPSAFYSIHREHYPAALKDQLEEAISFDWQENLLHEPDRTLHFCGPPLAVNHHISVPIFSLPNAIHDKFHTALNGSLFQSFSVVPSALLCDTFVSGPAPAGEAEDTFEILGRILDTSHLEVHRFYRGAFLDSMLIERKQHSLTLFRENMHCLESPAAEGADGAMQPHINLICSGDECAPEAEYGGEWRNEGLPISVSTIDDSFVARLVKALLGKDTIHAFDNEVLLKPWKVPKAVWPFLAAIVLFAVYAFYQVHASGSLARTDKQIRTQLAQYEMQWKPIEELQTRISKFQEDQKTLSEFNREGYPLMELLTFFTQITPDDTWLNYLSLRKGQIVIRGESKSAIKYLSELSKYDGFSDVKFASPVTRNPTSDQERFNVQIQLDMDKLKKNLDILPAEQFDPSPAGAANAKPAEPAVRNARPPEPGGRPAVTQPGPGPSTDQQLQDEEVPQ